MTEPMSQHQVESEILRLSSLAEKVTTELARRSTAAAEADVAYKLAYARSFVSGEGPMPMRAEQATLDAADELTAREVARAKEKAAQEAGRNYRAQLDALRSINSNLRHAITSASGVGS